jgi:hypothetical protein
VRGKSEGGRSIVSKQDRKYNGRVGEHYVLYRLLRERKDLNAVIAAPNTDTVDIYAADKAGKPCAVQVKTKTNRTCWQLGIEHEQIEDPGLFYAFVDLGKHFGVEKPKKDPPDIKEPPDVFIVPSKVVAKAVRLSHPAWLDTAAKSGKPKKDTDRRDICYDYKRARFGTFGEAEGFSAGWMDEYRERWDLLC